MTANTDTDLIALKDSYEKAKAVYIFLYKEMIKNGFDTVDAGLPDLMTKKMVSASYIIEATQDIFNVDIRKKSRRREIVKGRHAAIYMLSRYTKLSLMGIARLFYFKDHTSVINSKKTCGNWMNHDYEYRSNVDAVENLILAKIKAE